MPRPRLEVADIFRVVTPKACFQHDGPAYRRDHAGHLNLPQLRVMSAIETCRTAALGGHVAACTKCGHEHIAYNSCRNRHCPKCQGSTAKDWMQARMEDLLPVEYFHVVFTLPTQIADIAYQSEPMERQWSERHWRTRRSMACCSGRRRRRCSPLPPIPSILAQISA